MPMPQFKTKVKDLKAGNYLVIKLRIKGSNWYLTIRNAVVQKNGFQQYLYTGKPTRSFGEGTEVVFSLSFPFDLM